MKQTILLQGAVMAILVLILGIASSGGPAANNLYFTGAPSTGGGTELTCTICHNSGAGNYGEPQVSWTVAAYEGGPNETTYVPGETYFITVNVTAEMGSPAGYGFSSTFLMGESNNKAGTPFGADDNTRFTNNNNNENPRIYVEHRNRTPSGTWNFRWIAPTDGTGIVNIYSVGNAVDGLGGNSGDSGSTFSTIITLTETVLPVDLTEFTATADKAIVRLNWSTASEDDVVHFAVERSIDGETFTPIGRQTTSGNTRQIKNYAFTDREAPVGNLYYRLRIVDLDGSYAFSPIAQTQVTTESKLLIYPNPADVTVFIDGEMTETTKVRILDKTGRILRERRGAGTIDVADLPTGIYLLETVREGIRDVKKLVKR